MLFWTAYLSFLTGERRASVERQWLHRARREIACVGEVIKLRLVTSAKPISEILILAPWRTQRITGSAFRISFHPDWQIDNRFFNRPIMVHSQILVHRWGPRSRTLALFRRRTYPEFIFVSGAGEKWNSFPFTYNFKVTPLQAFFAACVENKRNRLTVKAHQFHPLCVGVLWTCQSGKVISFSCRLENKNKIK